ncbi:hypothetical protein U1Q18_036078, partial [Sarracenia purpurea var. burkii]
FCLVACSIAATAVGCRFAAGSGGAVLRLSRRSLLSSWALISQREGSSLLMFLLYKDFAVDWCGSGFSLLLSAGFFRLGPVLRFFVP